MAYDEFGDLLSGIVKEPVPTLLTDRDNTARRISPSERALWRKCRRMWSYSRVAVPVGSSVEAWFGTGWHYAMEDYLGLNLHGDIGSAFRAYARANPFDVGGTDGYLVLAEEMAEYFVTYWLGASKRQLWPVYEVNGIPQVEVRFEVPLTNGVLYTGIFDAVVRDGVGRLWIVDHKTVGTIRRNRAFNDPQMASYAWAGRQLYGDSMAGVVLMQYRRATPEAPKRLANDHLSTDKRQRTTYHVYLEAVKARYNGVVPDSYAGILQHLASLEDADSDNFIRRDVIPIAAGNVQAELDNMRLEVLDLLDADAGTLRIYPSPAFDCDYCPYSLPCSLQQQGRMHDAKMILTNSGPNAMFKALPDATKRDEWRERVQYSRELTDTEREILALRRKVNRPA